MGVSMKLVDEPKSVLTLWIAFDLRLGMGVAPVMLVPRRGATVFPDNQMIPASTAVPVIGTVPASFLVSSVFYQLFHDYLW